MISLIEIANVSLLPNIPLQPCLFLFLGVCFCCEMLLDYEFYHSAYKAIRKVQTRGVDIGEKRENISNYKLSIDKHLNSQHTDMTKTKMRKKLENGLVHGLSQTV